VNATNISRVSQAVAGVWQRLGVTPKLDRRGPVLLAPFTESYNLLHVAIPDLSREKVFDYLQSESIVPANIGDDADEKLAGFLFVTPSVGMIFVNASDIVVRQRFTAAHELGHFVLHRDEMGGLLSRADTTETIELTQSESDLHELEANQFAAELLMPEAVIRARVAAFEKAYGVAPRAALAYQLGAELLVSREAMTKRLKELEVGNE
jgi:Zn-dependent peptidase ImmA (M78 family)